MTIRSSGSFISNELSIIIPTYHRPEDLEILFMSILKQRKIPKEIVIVDDTPNNSVEKKILEYTDAFNVKGIKLIYKRNVGERSSARARNYGVNFTTSDLVLFLDNDTYLYQNYIEEIVKKFKIYTNALGFQGWIVGPGTRQRSGALRYFSYFFNKLFLLGSDSRNSCKMFEYPRNLDKTINCEWLGGCNMTLRQEVFNEFRFDDKLLKYSFSEDVLLSHSIYQKYPFSLYITPDAKILHFASDAGRMKSDDSFYRLIDSQRKYVLYKLYGLWGYLIYYRQKIGLFLLRNIFDNLFPRERPNTL